MLTAAHALALVGVTVILIFAPEQVHTSPARLEVSAVVLKKARVHLVSAPQELQLTDEDIRRGQVDVSAATVFTVRSNIPDGLVLQVAMDPRLVTDATVSGLAGVSALGGSSGLLRLQGPHRLVTRYELRWRLHLAPQARAGTYPWPVQVQMEGL